MIGLTIKSSFLEYGRKDRFSDKRQKRGEFDQINPTFGTNIENRNQEYWLGDLGTILVNQSLTQEQIAKSKVKVFDKSIDTLLQRYKVAKIDEVKNFLSKNRFLITLLEEIPSKVSNYFGNNQLLALKVSYEPEFPNSSELWVELLTELSAKEAMPILEKFDEEWWLENMERADCKLNVTLKFI